MNWRIIPACKLWFALICAIVFTAACGQRKSYKSPPGYDMQHPQEIKMVNELDEISGISYYLKDNSVFAESDEMGNLYKFSLAQPNTVKRWHFGHKHDYEDIAVVDSTFFLLSSNGDILALRLVSKDSFDKKYFNFPGKKYEFESLYYDDVQQKLVMVCKNCPDDKNHIVATYTIDRQIGTYTSGFAIDTKSISTLIKERSKHLKPSAAAIHPLTNELFILSAIDKLLIIADRNGVVKSAYELDPALFKQPEGLTFKPNGDMLISNESAGLGIANILMYTYKGQKK